MEIIYFIILVGVLIFVHELGHFFWAKFFGVRVLKFSLGFGPTIASIKRGGTEYVIAAIPLGGYVQMLGENPHEAVSEADQDASFSHISLWKRMVIVLAGPAMNLLFPLILLFVVFLGDTQSTPAVIGTVFPDGPADGVLLPGDRVLEADGEEIGSFYELARVIGTHPGQELELLVERAGEERSLHLTPELSLEHGPLDLVDEVGRVWIKPHHPLVVIGVTSPASPAASARLRTFDRVIAAAGRPIDRWYHLEAAIGSNRGTMIPLTYLRPTRLQRPLGGLVELDVYEPHVATLTPESGPGGGVSRAGIEPAELYLDRVSAAAGYEGDGPGIGDRLLEIDGRPIRAWPTLLKDLEVQGDTPHRLSWRRGDQWIDHSYRLGPAREVSGDERDTRILLMDPQDGTLLATLAHFWPTVLEEPVPNPNPIRYAMAQSIRVTGQLVELTAYSVIRLFQGRLSVTSLGGPLSVLEATGQAAREGALNYLSLMAFISVNLGLINLAPIPVLDGGHLLFIVIELVTRRPLSLRFRELASLIGLICLILLMTLAFASDLTRLWPRISAALTALGIF